MSPGEPTNTAYWLQHTTWGSACRPPNQRAGPQWEPGKPRNLLCAVWRTRPRQRFRKTRSSFVCPPFLLSFQLVFTKTPLRNLKQRCRGLVSWKCLRDKPSDCIQTTVCSLTAHPPPLQLCQVLPRAASPVSLAACWPRGRGRPQQQERLQGQICPTVSLGRGGS